MGAPRREPMGMNPDLYAHPAARERDEARREADAWRARFEEQGREAHRQAESAARLREALERIARADKPQNGIYELNIFDVADMARAGLENRSED